MSAKRDSSVSSEQARRWISETAAKAKSDQRKVSETPPPAEWKKAFGRKCKLSPDGRSFDLKLHDNADIKRAIEMQDGSRREEIRRGAEMQAKMPRERVVRRDGHILEFPEELVDHAKKNLRPVGRGGVSAAEHFGISDAARGYVQGPDGLYFHWDGGWEPTNLWRKEAFSPQRDPDGNVWVEADGEWLLMDEVT